MIDIKELRKVIADCYWPTSPVTINELLDRLEAAESEALEQARLNGMGSEREAALMAKLEAAEKDIAVKEEVIDSLAVVVKRLDAQCDAAEKEREMDEERIADLMADLNRVGHEIDALRAKITEMEKQAPLDAGSDVFRSAFEAALNAGYWPAARQGDGYRSPTTQIAWIIAFSTVNRLKLYALPGAQPQLNEIKLALQRALELGKRETWTGVRKHRSWEEQREEQQCWNKVWSLLGAPGEEK